MSFIHVKITFPYISWAYGKHFSCYLGGTLEIEIEEYWCAKRRLFFFFTIYTYFGNLKILLDRPGPSKKWIWCGITFGCLADMLFMVKSTDCLNFFHLFVFITSGGFGGIRNRFFFSFQKQHCNEGARALLTVCSYSSSLFYANLRFATDYTVHSVFFHSKIWQ